MKNWWREGEDAPGRGKRAALITVKFYFYSEVKTMANYYSPKSYPFQKENREKKNLYKSLAGVSDWLPSTFTTFSGSFFNGCSAVIRGNIWPLQKALLSFCFQCVSIQKTHI